MAKTEIKEKTLKERIATVGKITFLLSVVILAVYLITLIINSEDFFDKTAKETAEKELTLCSEEVNKLVSVHYENLYAISDKLENAQDKETVLKTIAEEVNPHGKENPDTDKFGDLRYFSKGNVYTHDGILILDESSEGQMLISLAERGTASATGVYNDTSLGVACVAFYVPVRGSSHVDGLLSILPLEAVVDISDLKNEKVLNLAVIDKSGIVLSSLSADSFGEATGKDYYTFIKIMTNDNVMVGKVGEVVSQERRNADLISDIGTEYVVASEPLSSFSGNIRLVSLTERQGLIAEELTYIRNIVNILIIAIVVIVIGLIYAFFYRKEVSKKIEEVTFTDSTIGCPNGEQFKILAENSIRERRYKYAVMRMSIRNYSYLTDNFSLDDSVDILKHIAKVIDTFTNPGEHYGYFGEGVFVVLIQFTDERHLRDKLKLVEGVINKHQILEASKTKLKFNIGICPSRSTRRLTIQEMINHATVAADSAETDVKLPFVVYSEKVSNERLHNERIEAEMESSLESGDFRLFLQPKYNIARDMIDSAEALVRWFDTQTGDYRFPGEFISLFESNGFITKLDKYMYLEVLKYLKSAADKGDKIVPISVNVSHVTASAPDFLNFYIENKKKYQVGDGFIVVEFTESFAIEDYDKISRIVEDLHANGIKCSLDDFGSGYASFSVLKNVTLDELKLDRLFLSPGTNAENDEKMLHTVISLAKSMGMKVVQEGVETKEMFENLAQKGCDVIQGYYYAKAIPVEEYKLFVNSDTSIKYKSRVK